MSINTHAFAGNPLRSKTPNNNDLFSPTTALETLKSRITDNTHHQSPNFKVLPFRNGKPLATSIGGESWQLGWVGLGELGSVLSPELSGDSFVYLGSDVDEDAVYWTIDVSGESGFVPEFGGVRFSFVELRTLMVATNWVDSKSMGNLAIAGHVSSFWLCFY
jgi:NAD+ diphosphatase